MTVPSGDIHALLAPLVIGVTGHRDLRPEDLHELKKKIRHILRGLKKQYPSTPIILLSPLAEGADRLAAVVALEEKARLVVPLPMTQRLYEQDFRSSDSLAEFHRLLALAERRVTVRMLADENELAHAGEARDRQYEEMGKRIARESQILIALWDGTDSGKVGGTAEVVKFQLHGIPSQTDCDLQLPELFPVYRIVTPRSSNPNPVGKPFDLETIYPERFKGDDKKKEAEAYYDQLFGNLEEFNLQILNHDDSLTAKATASKDEVLHEFDETRLSPDEALDLQRYAVADVLAQSFQAKMQRMDKHLHRTVFVAFICFVIFAHYETHPWQFLLAALVLVAYAYGVVKWRLPRAKLDSKSQDYRAVAEGSRVRFFWRLAGLRESVAESYLKQRTELDWIRNGLRGWELEAHMAPQAGPSPPKERLEEVRELWVDAQIGYFGKSITNKEKKKDKEELEIRVCAWLAGLIAVSTLVVWLATQDDGVLSWLIIATEVCLITWALLHHSSHQKAYPQHIKQFGRMKAVFGRARKLIDEKLRANDLVGAQRCLLKLGREALEENGDWVFLRRERPLELPPP